MLIAAKTFVKANPRLVFSTVPVTLLMYDRGVIPSTGFKAVIVNGEVTVRDDELLEVFAGQPIRFEPEARPRFEPVSEEVWNRSFSTGMPDVAPGIPASGGD